MKHKFWLNQEFSGLWMWAIGLALLAGVCGADSAVAATAKEIDVSVDVALENFEKDVDGAKQFLANAKGLLHRVRQDDEPLRGLQGDRESAEPDLFA